MKRGLQLAIGCAFAGLFVWLTLRQVDLTEVQAAAKGLSWGWIAAAPLILSIGYFFRILRWHMMLRPHNPDLGLGTCGMALVASIAVNNLLPFRAGDLLRCFGFSGWLKVAPGPVLATVMVERSLDLAVLIVALALGLWWFALQTGGLGLSYVTVAGLAATGLAALTLLLRPHLLRPVLNGLLVLCGVFGPNVRARADAFVGPLLATLISLSGRRAMPALMGLSVLVWLMEGATYLAIARAMPALPNPDAAWLVMPVGTLSTLLPSTPGHVGTFDYFAQLAAVSAGNPLAEATAFVLVAHVALWLPTTVIGSLCLLVWALSQRAPGAKARP